jgi:hypothetical protein
MTKSEAPHHNSKPITKKTFLPPLQKKIFLYLANHEPSNINETADALKCHYRSCWGAFGNLEKKKLIKTVESKKYHGQEFPRYWVTEDGAFVALCEGAKADAVIRRANEFYPKRKDLHYLLESVSILGTDAFNVGYLAFVSKGKLEQSDIALMMITQIQNGLSDDAILKFNKMLENYPDQKQKLDDALEQLGKNFKNLFALFEKTKSDNDGARS